MKSSIFIPKTINVGYQNRSDTYTGKLAYVIYYDEKGRLRKEASWNSWRDEKIPNEEFDNVPTSGFVLNRRAGGVEESWGWNARKTYCRIYDPRNFEFEITIENLLYILENANSIKGKGLEGEFVYGWDGKDLVLMPVESPDYKQISEYNRVIHNNETIKAKDLIVGATYLTKDNVEYVYMGRFDKYENCYWKNGHAFRTRKKMEQWCEDNDIPPLQNGRYYWQRYEEDCYEPASVGKQHCFYYKRETYGGELVDDFCWMSSMGKNLISVVNEKCCENYADLFYLLEGTNSYSPIDKSKEKYFDMSFEEFYANATSKYSDNSISYRDMRFMSGSGELKKYEMRTRYNSETNGKYVLYEYSKDNIYNGDREVLNIFPTEEREVKKYWGETGIEKHMIPVTLEDIFNKLKPVYKQIYLANGREYVKEYRF